MELRLPIEEATRYKSLSQRARVVTEAWAERSIFCPACPSSNVARARNNTEAFDFRCSECGARYQLKASSRPITGKIFDAGYEAMMRAIRHDALPHFLVLRYDIDVVSDLLLIPSFSLSSSAIEPRKPLSPNARRAGWVGCNILTTLVPPECRIYIVESGQVMPRTIVRSQFKHVAELSNLPPSSRGWTLDVLTSLRKLGKRVFTLGDAYATEGEMARLHPQNRHVREKIRQQLQVLRDLGYLWFKERAVYEFTEHA